MTTENGLGSFRAGVLADASLAATLGAIEDVDRFVDAARRTAADRGIAISEDTLRQASRPDPLNIARFAPKPPDGAFWPPLPWLPVHIGRVGHEPVIDWAWFGVAPLTDPFFESEIRRASGRPFNRLFGYRMTLADFLADAPRQQCLPPDGLIFHMSRCGSTLAAQMLAALPDTIVISEAAPIDTIVQSCRTAPHLPEQTHVALLRAIVAAYGRPRGGHESRFVLKLDCWHALALPLFRHAFPATPWTFLYRDPVEVLVSHARQRGSQMVPSITPPELYGIADHTGATDADYWAHVLAVICEEAATHIGNGAGLAVDYRELPEAVFSRILPHFGIRPSAAEQALMAQAARQDAKAPHFAFADDRAGKQGEAGPALRATAEARLGPVYRRLEALNSAQKSGVLG